MWLKSVEGWSLPPRQSTRPVWSSITKMVIFNYSGTGAHIELLSTRAYIDISENKISQSQILSTFSGITEALTCLPFYAIICIIKDSSELSANRYSHPP